MRGGGKSPIAGRRAVKKGVPGGKGGRVCLFLEKNRRGTERPQAKLLKGRAGCDGGKKKKEPAARSRGYLSKITRQRDLAEGVECKQQSRRMKRTRGRECRKGEPQPVWKQEEKTTEQDPSQMGEKDFALSRTGDRWVSLPDASSRRQGGKSRTKKKKNSAPFRRRKRTPKSRARERKKSRNNTEGEGPIAVVLRTTVFSKWG